MYFSQVQSGSLVGHGILDALARARASAPACPAPAQVLDFAMLPTPSVCLALCARAPKRKATGDGVP
eukprot:5982714-Alexandrium_andersonii.AAC.1